MEKTGRNKFLLSSGRLLYAFDYVIGIDDDLKIYGGYDNNLYPDDWGVDDGDTYARECNMTDESHYTPEDGIEIAYYMIELWQKFAVQQATKKKDE
jgi:hypothetical protein